MKSAKDIYVDIAPFAYREGGMPTSPGFHDWFKTSPSGPMTGKVIDMLPPFFKRMWGPLTVWMWFGLVLGVIITLGLMFTLYRIQRRIALKTKRSNIFTYCFSAIFSVAAALLPYLFSEFAAIYLCIRGTPLYVTSFACNFVSLLALLIVIFSFAMRFAEALIASPKINPRGLDAQVIRITSKLLALVISTVVFLEGGQFLGIPVTTLLASAGVGGVAVALAAQDTIKNVFATVTLMADRPFRIGERIVFNQYDGVVEEIGLRSTRVRLLNGHLTTIPNDVIASKDVENISRRPFIRRSSNIRLPLDTSPDKLQQALSIVRGAVNHHEGMEEDFPPRVYFDEINDNSFNLIFIYWFHPADYWSYLAFSEDVNLKITQGFEAAGIRFWIPTRLTKHSESDSVGPANDPWMRPEDGGSSSPLNQPNQDAGDAS